MKMSVNGITEYEVKLYDLQPPSNHLMGGDLDTYTCTCTHVVYPAHLQDCYYKVRGC